MRILHTSDLHLGTVLYNHDRYAEFEVLLQSFYDYLENEQKHNNPIDVFMIAGDIFNTSNPSNIVKEQFAKFIKKLSKSFPKMQILIIAGNHDSAAIIELNDSICVSDNIVYRGKVHYIQTKVENFVVDSEDTSDNGSNNSSDTEAENFIKSELDFSKHIVPLKNNKGEIKAFVALIPYASKPISLDSRALFPNEKISDNVTHTLNEKLTALYQIVKDEIFRLKQEFNCPNAKVIAMGHCAVIGKKATYSAENGMIGGEEVVDDSIWSGYDYVALGHIHMKGFIANNSNQIISYCGAPIPVNYNDAKNKESFNVINIDEENNQLTVETVVLKRIVDFITIPENGSDANGLEYSEVLKEIKQLGAKYQDNGYRPFLRVFYKRDKQDPSEVVDNISTVSSSKVKRAKKSPKIPTTEYTSSQMQDELTRNVDQQKFRICNFTHVKESTPSSNTSFNQNIANKSLQEFQPIDVFKYYLNNLQTEVDAEVFDKFNEIVSKCREEQELGKNHS